MRTKTLSSTMRAGRLQNRDATWRDLILKPRAHHWHWRSMGMQSTCRLASLPRTVRGTTELRAFLGWRLNRRCAARKHGLLKQRANVQWRKRYDFFQSRWVDSACRRCKPVAVMM
jgi:hypothetical protein